jgi:protein disulfide-isomerase
MTLRAATLVKLDLPRSIQQSRQLVAQNQKLQQQYGIRGYPTVIVLNGDGKKVGKLGYQEGGPGPFVDRLKGL